jgi:cytochrome b6-f complex iron-sulfur subunit
MNQASGNNPNKHENLASGAPSNDPDSPPAPEQMDRRDFLKMAIGGAAALGTIAIVGFPVARFIQPPPVAESAIRTAVAARKDELAVNSGKIFRFGEKPALLIRHATGEYSALMASCTHLDCIVQYRPDNRDIWCACHNGVYDVTGRNVSGPPPRPLEALAVRVSGDEVIVSRKT